MSAHDNIFDAPPTDPMSVFDAWLAEAGDSEPNDPNAMTLATVDADGMPNARVVLLKGHDARGFVFYTNLQSQKGGELEATQKASLCFHWKTLGRQVRVQGPTSRVDEQEADAYFASRGRDSRIGAWASAQSRPLDSRDSLAASVAEVEARFPDDVPRPPHWGGFLIVPQEIEFWADGDHRLHDRFRFTPDDAGNWDISRLNP